MTTTIKVELGLTLQVADHQFAKASIAVEQDLPDVGGDLEFEESKLYGFVEDTLIKRIYGLIERAEKEGLI